MEPKHRTLIHAALLAVALIAIAFVHADDHDAGRCVHAVAATVTP